jgi:hypothetical protein
MLSLVRDPPDEEEDGDHPYPAYELEVVENGHAHPAVLSDPEGEVDSHDRLPCPRDFVETEFVEVSVVAGLDSQACQHVPRIYLNDRYISLSTLVLLSSAGLVVASSYRNPLRSVPPC